MEEQTLEEVLQDPESFEASKASFVSGIVSAAADVDPTTVATLAIAGATIVYGLEWLVILIVPMFAVVQMIGTQVATVCGEGLQSAVRRRYGLWIAMLSLVCIIGVNVITYAADLEAGAAALHLLTSIPFAWFLVPISLGVVVLLVYGSMDRVRRVLILLPLAFLAYVATTFIAHPNWHDVAQGLIPRLRSDNDYISTVVALIGTSLTTYSYYWQTVEIAAEAPPKRAVWAVQLASLPGTLITGVVLWFILIGTASTLGAHHKSVDTAQEAAQALAPIAGQWASAIFGIGLFGSAMLALPVIAAGTASAVSTTFRWGGSLDKRPRDARRFYATLFIGVATATALALFKIPPIKLLFWASIAGGFGTPITLGLLVLLSRSKRMMAGNISPAWLATAGWIVTAVITIASLAFIRWH
ncbi:MAG: divalent metal cation transporter [Candidatus Eremiobacteraeota bacterium]|nr:divalent metal cation transporter [Candidatus Eremiobacteraeota bacterium]